MTAVALAADLLRTGEPLLWAAFLVFCRVGTVMAVLPAFGEQSVPARVRLVLAGAFTAVVAPAAMPLMPAGVPALPALLAEVAAGLILGLGFRLLVHALQTGATIIAQSTALAQIAGAAAEPQPAIGHLMVVAGLALAVSAGLHVTVAEALIRSYDALPAARFPAAADVADWGVVQAGRAFALAFAIAAPFVIASLLYNVALGAINRAMPQLMVALVGAPALSLGTLALLAAAAPVGLAAWTAAMAGYGSAPFGPAR